MRNRRWNKVKLFTYRMKIKRLRSATKSRLLVTLELLLKRKRPSRQISRTLASHCLNLLSWLGWHLKEWELQWVDWPMQWPILMPFKEKPHREWEISKKLQKKWNAKWYLKLFALSAKFKMSCLKKQELKKCNFSIPSTSLALKRILNSNKGWRSTKQRCPWEMVQKDARFNDPKHIGNQ